MSNWYLGRNGQQEGPFTAEHISKMLERGEISHDGTLVWKNGMSEWVPLSSSELMPQLSQTLPPTPFSSSADAPAQSGNQYPYTPPAAEKERRDTIHNPYTGPSATLAADYVDPNQFSYPGIGRLAYFLLNTGFGILVLATIWYLAPTEVAGNEAGSEEMMERLEESLDNFGIANLLINIISLFIGVLRVRNLGMSGWFILLEFVPIINIWLGWRMIACPEGYADHKQLDLPGKIITAIYLLFFALILVAIVALFYLFFSAPAPQPAR